jgi:hypothetical protein
MNSTSTPVELYAVSIALYVVVFLLCLLVVFLVHSVCKRRCDRNKVEVLLRQAKLETRRKGIVKTASSAKRTRFERSQGAKSNASSSPGVKIVEEKWVDNLENA